MSLAGATRSAGRADEPGGTRAPDRAAERPPGAARGERGAGNRLSICYVVPGHSLLPSAGPTRNVLGLAGALGPLADVTVAFRRTLEPPSGAGGLTVRELDPARDPRSGGARPRGDDATDDAAVRGVGYLEFARYLWTLRRFVAADAHRYDLVLEKGWLLSGYVSALCRRRGVPAIPVENLVPHRASAGSVGATARLRHRVGRWLAGRFLRGAPAILAETGHLRDAMAELWGIDPDRIRVVELGVDRERFRPGDREAARRRLGIDVSATVLLYVGVLDRLHDLAPVLDGIADARRTVRLHVVGDGPLRGAYEERTKRLGLGDRVAFHGRVPHGEVPAYVDAADLCLAPYDPDAFFRGEVAYSTLKIREYLAAGRPVASVASGEIPRLVREGETGFLVRHDPAAWAALLRDLPARDRLHEMGDAAAREPTRGWDDVGRDVLRIARGVLASDPAGRTARVSR